MTYDGYLNFGGNEIGNNARTRGYAETAACPMPWFKGEVCEGIWAALGETALYTHANIASAPWYDSANADLSSRFFGVYLISVSGIQDSTRKVTVTEGIGDGGALSGTRKAVKDVRVRALLVANGRDALGYGMAWLSSVLDPGACGQHGTGCGTVDLAFYAECPPDPATVTKKQVQWQSPRTNLSPNPSFETPGVLTEVRRNLATNPSFETTGATVEVRRNLAINPNAAGADGFSPNDAHWTVTKNVAVPATHPQGITTAARSQNTGTPSNYLLSMFNLDGLGIGAPARWTGAWFYANAAGYRATWTAGASWVTLPANTWVWVARDTQWPAGHNGAWIETVSGGLCNPAHLGYITGVTAYANEKPTEAIWGGRAAAGDFTYLWLGTVNASATAQRAVAVDTTSAISSTAWSADRGKSARIIPAGLTNDSFFSPGGDLGGMRLGMVAGKSYTISATLHLNAPQTAPLNVLARTITPFLKAPSVNGGNYMPYPSTAPPNVAGDHRVSTTVTLPADTTEVFIRLYNGADIGKGDVWWDALTVVEGVYTGPYFDGAAPAKVRRNLALTPQRNTGPATGWNIGNRWGGPAPWAYTQTDGVATTVPGTSITTCTRKTWTATGTGAPQDIAYGMNAGARIPASPGEVYTVSYYLRSSWDWKVPLYNWVSAFCWDAASGGNLIEQIVSPGGWVSAPAPGEWTRYSLTLTVPAGATHLDVLHTLWFTGDTATWPVVGSTLDATGLLVEKGTTVVGAFFDARTPIAPYAAAWDGTVDASPSYLYDPDFSYAWSGAADASASSQRGIYPATYPAAGGVSVQSTHWAGNRAKSVRVIPNWPVRGSGYIDVAGTGMERGLVPGQTYTMSVTLRMTAPQGYAGNLARSLILVSEATGGGLAAITEGADVAGTQRLSMTFTIPATGWWYLRLMHGGASGDPDIWWDELLIEAGPTARGYFDGAFPDSDETQAVGTAVNRYAWTGAADASTSTHEAGTIAGVLDPVAWQAKVDGLRRYLHDVGAVSGPLVVEEYEAGPFFGNLVQFVLTAERPWVYKAMKPIALPPALPVVVQDIPFNLITHPSAELASGTVVVARNYSANPSVETDATGWAHGSTVVIAGNVTSARSTALAAQGGASFRARFVATNAASGGTILAENTSATFPSTVSGTRMSVNLWVTSQLVSGTAVLGATTVEVVWRNVTTVLRTDVVGTVPSGGGALSSKAIAPPVGSNNAILRAKVALTSWQIGATVDLYADAAAVTVP